VRRVNVVADGDDLRSAGVPSAADGCPVEVRTTGPLTPAPRGTGHAPAEPNGATGDN
jgi:hypothetical protein